jgi:glycosyltransferase involved in cell wall biosynthesis
VSGISGKLKILIYGEYFLPVVGGVQTSMNLLARGLLELNASQERDASFPKIEVTVVTRTAANGMDDTIFPYLVVRRPRFRMLIKLIREADVIHVAGPCLLPMLIGWLTGKPVLVEHHGYQAICPNGLLFREPSRTVCSGYFAQRQYGKCVRCASQTMGLGGGVRSLLLTFPRRWLCKKIVANITISDHVATRLNLPHSRTVYYGIEETCDATVEDTTSSQSDVSEVGYVGRLVVEKGPHVLLHAAKLLSNRGNRIRVVFIGDGPERNRLEELTDDLRLKDFVRFTGDLRGLAFAKAVSRLKMVVMPSLCEETAGLSAIEQMMRGRVVVVTDIGGLTEIVGDAGLKFAPGDSRALAECIRKVLDDPFLEASLGMMARERAMQLFKLDSMIEAHVFLYRAVSR